eukprot:evm.model.NODE_14860_length_9296_cov_17.491287.2
MPTMSGKRARKPVQKLGDFEDSGAIGNDAGFIASTSGGSNSRANQLQQRAGRANKKRDDRSALVEVWMCKNESGNKPATVVKEEYAKQLRIRKELFWDTMKAYALKSKLACIPDFEQIWHHMKDDKADLLQDLRLQGVDYWSTSTMKGTTTPSVTTPGRLARVSAPIRMNSMSSSPS